MRCVELLLAIGGGVAPPPVHETSLESGVRIVVATRAPSAELGATELVDAVLIAPVGFANDATQPGSGLAQFAADHVTDATDGKSPWSAEVRAESTLYVASFASDGLEAGLAALARKLTPDGADEEHFNEFMTARRAPPSTVAERFREAAFPTTREGTASYGLPGEVKKLNREMLKEFLVARYGSEGCVLALVGSGPAARLELAATRAFAQFPRARGVPPSFALEPFPTHARKVSAPPATSSGMVGLRLPWRDDPHIDGVAFARAWLEAVAASPAAVAELTPQGALIGFEVVGDADARQVRDSLTAALGLLSADRPLSADGIAAALDRMDAGLDEAMNAPNGWARVLAESAFAVGDPLAPFSRRSRLAARDAAALAAELKSWLPQEGWIEVTALPAASPGGA